MPKSTNQLAIRKDEITTLVKEAIDFHERAQASKNSTLDAQQAALFNAWQCGIRLNKIKALVGHGHWNTWLDVHFCKPHGLSDRTARLYMKIDNDNPKLRHGKANRQRVADLAFDTIRKHAYSFVPEKERPKLEERHKIPRLMHHLTVVNEFFKWKRRRDIGLIEANPKEERRDFKPVFEWLRDNLFAD